MNSPSAPIAPLRPGDRLGRYEILELVGSGTMGAVYRARDTKDASPVAVRLLDTLTPPVQEAAVRAATGLNHPHICRVFGIERVDGHTILVAEFVEGHSLQTASRNGLKYELVLGYGRQIAEALGHAHRKGVIHGNLKTSSIVITPDGSAKILDFGMPAPPTALPYTAPERLRGESIGPPADVWALGVMFWEVTEGKPPFAGKSDVDLASAILYSPLVSPPLSWPDAFMAVVFRCLARSIDTRFADAAAVSEALHDIPLTEQEHAHSRWKRIAGYAAASFAAVAVAGYLVKGWIDQPASRPRASISNITAIQPSSIAVLPFKPADQGARDATLEVGVADALITSLGRLNGITVRPISAVLRYADRSVTPQAASSDLGVDAILDGTFRWNGDQISVFLRLSDASGRVVWSDTFASGTGGLAGLHSVMAKRAAEKISTEFDEEVWASHASHDTRTTAAFRAQLDGRYQWNRRTEPAMREAIPFFERATTLDPRYALAFAELADADLLLGISGAPGAIERARSAAQRAVLEDNSLAEAHASLARVRWLVDWNFDEAESEFRWARDLNPNNLDTRLWYARFLASRSHFAEALSEIEAARNLDPTSLSVRFDAAEVDRWARQYDIAVTELRTVIDRDSNAVNAHTLLGLTYLQQGRRMDGIAALERARTIDNNPRTTSALAYGYGVAGQQAKGEALLRELESPRAPRQPSPFDVAFAHVGLGHRDQALQWLERALRERSTALVTIDVDPALDRLRGDPRFKDLVKKIESQRRS